MCNKGMRVLTAVLSLLLAALIGGCAGNTQTVKAPAFEKEQWDKLAEKSKGYSPSTVKRDVNLTEYRRQVAEDNPVVTEKKLPDIKVSLKLRNSDVKSILRALARATDTNILVKDDIKGAMSIDFVATPWDQVFNSVLNAYGLTYVWEGDILRILTNEDIEQKLKTESLREKQKNLKLSENLVENLSTVIVPIDYADAKSLKDNLQDFLTKDKDGKPRGYVKVDQHTNSLIIQAVRADIEKMLPLIERIDRPARQILIRANIVETTKNIARDLGIQWGGAYKRAVDHRNLWVVPGGQPGVTTAGTTASAIRDPVSGGYSPTSGATGLGGQGMGISFPVAQSAIQNAGGIGSLGLMFGTLGGNILEAQLQALQKDGKLNILSSPSITTLDNHKAFAESGEKVPYVSTASTGGSVTQTVSFVDAVLRLEITPHVIDGKNMKMQIVVKKDEVDMSRSVLGNPFIIKKDTETTLIVQDGETVVISGLTRQRNTETVSGVPGLKDIPFFGWFFKGESKSDALEEVIIFITPHILPPRMADAGADDQTTQKK